MNPYKESDSEHYCRLLRPARVDPSTLLKGVTKLGIAMTDKHPSQTSIRPIIPIDAGYTYFGQFIDHDLTKDKSSLEDAGRSDPHQIRNEQTPYLDLSHLYGKGPGTASPDGGLYDAQNPDCFKLGAPLGHSGQPFDIYVYPPDETGVPMLADDRSGENWILRQITAFFYRLHNYAAASEDHCDPTLAGRSAFERARLQTTWQFQWLVRHFLSVVLDPEVYSQVFDDITAYKPRFKWRTTFSIPAEFSVAAFRFGHSMVQESYKFSLNLPSFKLVEIFGRKTDRGPLPNKAEIDWARFIRNASPIGGDPVTARPIDTQITDPLHDLPDKLVRLFNRPSAKGSFLGDPPQLPVRTLRRGLALKLASGQAAAKTFGISALTEDQLIRNSKGEISEAGIVLKQYDMIDCTPLWHYILKESEVWHNGNHVGPTGSYIIAETIHGALRHAPEPFLVEAFHRGPPLWKFPNGNQGSMNNLRELFSKAAAF